MMNFNQKMKNLFFTLILIGVSIQLNAAFILWDAGGDGTTWNDPLNWDGDVVPTLGDDVNIVGFDVVVAANAMTSSIEIKSGGSLTINSGVTLMLTGNTDSAPEDNDAALDISSSSAFVTNDGTIIISDSVNDGISSRGTFNNNGMIMISDFDDDGLAVDDASSVGSIFNNSGSIDVIMASGGKGEDEGIFINDGSTLVNTGVINITVTGAGDVGLATENGGLFDNQATTNISGSRDHGIMLRTGTGGTDGPSFVDNSGSIIITGNDDDGDADGIRVREASSMTNSGSIILVDNDDEGIQVDDACTFTNSGTIDISGSSQHGMELFGTFNNMTGALYKAENCGFDDPSNQGDGIRCQNSAIFNNDGDIRIDNSASEDIETETIASWVNTANATFAPGSSPGDLEIRDDFDLGTSTTTFEIDGTAATTEYDQIIHSTSSNSITISSATADLVWGFTPTVGNCFTIVDASGTVNGQFAAINSSDASINFETTYTGSEVEICIIAAALPVELTTFEGRMQEATSILNWETASELNNKGFEIEHSTDGRTFAFVDFVLGNGTTQTVSEYSFIHKDPTAGDNYYRLKQIDFDGAFEYSDIVYLENTKNDAPGTIYPNPAVSEVTYEGAPATLSVYDALGQLVLQELAEVERTTLDISQLQTGVYFMEITTDSNEITVKRFMKQ